MDSLSSQFEGDFVEMGRLAHLESGFADKIEYDPERLLSVARNYARDDNKFLVVAVDGGRAVGVFAGHLSEIYFSSAKLARDVLWYVLEEYRVGGIGLELLARFESWAEYRDAKMVYVSQDSGIHTDKFTKSMNKRGYDFVGSNYTLGVSG